GQKTIFPVLKGLLAKKIIFISEELNEKFKPKKTRFITLNAFYDDKENLKALFGILEKSPKQLDTLLAYLKLLKENAKVSRTVLAEAAGVSAAVIKALIDKNIFEVKEEIISRFLLDETETENYFKLSEG